MERVLRENTKNPACGVGTPGNYLNIYVRSTVSILFFTHTQHREHSGTNQACQSYRARMRHWVALGHIELQIALEHPVDLPTFARRV